MPSPLAYPACASPKYIRGCTLKAGEEARHVWLFVCYLNKMVFFLLSSNLVFIDEQ